jgi:hypothetical protein
MSVRSISLSGFVVSYRSGRSGFARFERERESVSLVIDSIACTAPLDGDRLSVDAVGSETSIHGARPYIAPEIEMVGSGGSWQRR